MIERTLAFACVFVLAAYVLLTVAPVIAASNARMWAQIDAPILNALQGRH